MKRWLLVAGAVVVVLGLVTGGLWVFLPPDHRTTFLIDASESADFREVADAVGAAASNMAADDSLALRRFGGACDGQNTAELVSPGTGQAAKIGDAARAITPSGKATLLSGILAAIDDFSRTYPFRGDKTNRVVVVARNGADACGKNADEVRAIIEEHTRKAGVKIDFRFVGHRLTPEQAKVLAELAAATDAQKPRLTKTSDELVTTMKEVSVPADLAVKEVKVAPCDFVTPEVLAAVHKPGDGVVYADVKCQQDRYTLAMMRTTRIESNDMPTLFEYKDDAWRFVKAQTDMPCGDVPKEVWKAWEFPCLFEPVVCRDTEQSKVTDLDGVGCPAALDIADRYNAAIKAGEPQGQGLFWESGEWSCAWPYEDGYAHAQVPLKCVRTTDKLAVQIGDYQR
ncbi:hypothetical protein [Lentzea flava]|uniref:VWFA domain-containing protein n=1 Tax=Lentzea flava TaxID=103732 RepID=A0ABQ2V0F2_9PSEU|nr:hypothetical protein [Lentzea flava]MCP2202650.1 von Willebrand factor type A domain [Lentzea flava]GGU62213.1 hypothetical protein GCM10010178_63020 [Lentzea flava]